MQERSELLAAQKGELEVLLARRSVVEQEFMEQYLAACEQYEEELERLRVDGAVEHGTLKRRPVTCPLAVPAFVHFLESGQRGGWAWRHQ